MHGTNHLVFVTDSSGLGRKHRHTVPRRSRNRKIEKSVKKQQKNKEESKMGKRTGKGRKRTGKGRKRTPKKKGKKKFEKNKKTKRINQKKKRTKKMKHKKKKKLDQKRKKKRKQKNKKDRKYRQSKSNQTSLPSCFSKMFKYTSKLKKARNIQNQAKRINNTKNVIMKKKEKKVTTRCPKNMGSLFNWL